MPIQDPTLHGNAPDESPVTLMLVDTINDLEYEGGRDLLKYALPMAERILKLKQRAKGSGIPVVYVNDNFGKWRSDFSALIRHCLHDNVTGTPVAALLKPDPDDYFVLKPKNSGFYSTPLNLLLKHLGARTLILTGMAADNCILFTAGDAYIRGYQLVVPSDCVACIDPKDKSMALAIMEKTLKADIRLSGRLDMSKLIVHRK